MVLLVGPHRFFVVQETFDGEIALSPSGLGGFGYDPVFFVPSEGKTVAEIPSTKKNELSHRGKALAKLRSLIADLDM